MPRAMLLLLENPREKRTPDNIVGKKKATRDEVAAIEAQREEKDVSTCASRILKRH